MASAINTLHTHVNTNYDSTKVTGMAGKPEIRLGYSEDPSSTNINGEIEFSKQQNGGNNYTAGYLQKRFVIRGFCYYENATADTTIMEMFDELIRWCHGYNQTSSNPYEYYLLDYDSNGSILAGKIDFAIEAYTKLTIADGT